MSSSGESPGGALGLHNLGTLCKDVPSTPCRMFRYWWMLSYQPNLCCFGGALFSKKNFNFLIRLVMMTFAIFCKLLLQGTRVTSMLHYRHLRIASRSWNTSPHAMGTWKYHGEHRCLSLLNWPMLCSSYGVRYSAPWYILFVCWEDQNSNCQPTQSGRFALSFFWPLHLRFCTLFKYMWSTSSRCVLIAMPPLVIG